VEHPVRILLVEDNEVYRSSLELLLGMEPGLEVVGSVGEGSAAAAAAAELEADVVLMDFRLPGVDGAEATAHVLAARPEAAVVCLTAEASESEREAVRAAGAAAFVDKGESVAELVAVIRRAAAGERGAS
jgi:DNA-binding NarL/FixJ family response regulator